MGTFADVLLEATEHAARAECPTPLPFAGAVRIIEDRVAGAAVTSVVSETPMWVRPLGAQMGAAACARYVARAVCQPARSSINVDA